MDFIKTFFLFVVTAVAEIVGCYQPYLWLKQDKSPVSLVGMVIIMFGRRAG